MGNHRGVCVGGASPAGDAQSERRWCRCRAVGVGRAVAGRGGRDRQHSRVRAARRPGLRGPRRRPCRRPRRRPALAGDRGGAGDGHSRSVRNRERSVRERAGRCHRRAARRARGRVHLADSPGGVEADCRLGWPRSGRARRLHVAVGARRGLRGVRGATCGDVERATESGAWVARRPVQWPVLRVGPSAQSRAGHARHTG